VYYSNRTTPDDLLKMKEEGRRIVMISVDQYYIAAAAERCGADIICVPATVGMTALGHKREFELSMDDFVRHCKAASRARKTALLVAEMPFGSYEVSEEDCLRNAIRLIKEGGADAVLLKGGLEIAPLIKALNRHGIAAMAEVGLLPDDSDGTKQMNGCLVQGQDESSARQLVEAAEELEEAGAFAIVLNCVTSVSARFLAEKLDVPVIGVGAGAGVDGQQLPYEQLLGLEPNTAHFARKYADLHEVCMSALAAFCADVREGRFPNEEESFAMDPDEAVKLY